jgi:antitoxin (DNA-binding transcriptional repressor) of toxin-antitoxin stability system
MANYSVAEAKNNLSKLIDRALKGERVTITRHDAPVVELRAVGVAVRPISAEALADLDALRSRPSQKPKQSAAELVRQMRDEGDH